MSWVQDVSNWLLGEYRVRTTKLTDSSLIQHVRLTDDTGAYVAAGGGSGGGDASAANQLLGNASLTSIDAKTPALGQALAAASVPIVLTAAQLTTLTPPAAIAGYATSAKQDTGNTSLASIDSKLTNPLPVSAASLPLPTGASTSALQTTGNTSLSSIDLKVPALGQALAAASVPIVLTAAQLSTLTPPAAITGFATETTLSALNTKVTAVNTGAVVLAAGTAIAGKFGIDQTTPGTTNLVALTAETTKVIGVVRTADGAGNLLTSTTNALDVNIKSGSTTLTSVIPGTGATNLGKAEDSPASDGDTGVFILGVRNDSVASTLTNANGDYSAISVSPKGEVYVAGGKVEDDSHTSGDHGLFVMAVRNDSLGTTFCNANGDYSPFAVGSKGEIFTRPSDGTNTAVYDSAGRNDLGGSAAANLETLTQAVLDLRDYTYNNFAPNIPQDVQLPIPLSASSAAYENSRIGKSSKGLLFSISGFSSKTSSQWIQIFDSITLPPDGAIPIVPPIYVGGTQNFSWDSTLAPFPISYGIVVCNSTTGPTKTIGSNDCMFNIRYI